MKIAIVTDAWHPQINGVVTTLSWTARCLEELGHEVVVINPQLFRSFPLPSYPEIRLAWKPYRKLRKMLDEFRPHCVHVATEGTLGLAGRRYCIRNGLRFTTSYHTQFPQYVRKRVPVPIKTSYRFLRRFHGAARRTLVATADQQRELENQGLENIVRWGRGVDTGTFKPGPKSYLDFPRPIWAYVGRIAVEKGLEAFLSLDIEGTKLLIGDGPDRKQLEAAYPEAEFAGYRFGDDLAGHLAASDAFVFPSRTDTFGLVMIEAMACGLPVAAFPVTGPIDVVGNGVTGVLHEDLAVAARAALKIDPAVCVEHARKLSWPRATEQFLGHLVVNGPVKMQSTLGDAGSTFPT